MKVLILSLAVLVSFNCMAGPDNVQAVKDRHLVGANKTANNKLTILAKPAQTAKMQPKLNLNQ